MREELRLADALRIRCRDLNLPLWILGPSRRPDDFWLDRLCVRLDRRLRDQARQWAVPYAGIPATHDAQGQRLYCADSFHLNPSGHAYVVSQLESILAAGLRQTPAAAPARAA